MHPEAKDLQMVGTGSTMTERKRSGSFGSLCDIPIQP